MNLYIQIRNGQPYEHPIMENNFREAFPHIDVDNLPPEFAKFERVPNPENATLFQVNEVSYQWVNGIVKDVWTTREMNAEEKEQKTQERIISINKFLQLLKEIAQREIANTTGEVQQAWQNYAQQLNVWVLQDVENPVFPKMPKILQDGTVATINTSGSAPNVIE